MSMMQNVVFHISGISRRLLRHFVRKQKSVPERYGFLSPCDVERVISKANEAPSQDMIQSSGLSASLVQGCGLSRHVESKSLILRQRREREKRSTEKGLMMA